MQDLMAARLQLFTEVVTVFGVTAAVAAVVCICHSSRMLATAPVLDQTVRPTVAFIDRRRMDLAALHRRLVGISQSLWLSLYDVGTMWSAFLVYAFGISSFSTFDCC